jgi:FkbM family methyltransferase
VTAWTLPEVDGVIMDSHEGPLRPIIQAEFPDGGVFVDIGANVGLWTVLLGERASSVYAIEPSPETVAVLHRNIALNGLTNVEVLQMAAWDTDAEFSLAPPPGHEHDMRTGWMRVVVTPAGPIQGHRLDDVLPMCDRIDLVKVDTEGADLHALRGMENRIREHQPALFVESSHTLPYGYPLEQLTGLLTQLGYGWEWLPDWGASRYMLCRPS